MPEFQEYSCDGCGSEFKAVEGAKAAETGYCSPRCESEGTGLA